MLLASETLLSLFGSPRHTACSARLGRLPGIRCHRCRRRSRLVPVCGKSGLRGFPVSASESSAATCAVIRDDVAPNAPAFAKEVLDHAVGTLPARSAVMNVYATMVWDAPALGASEKDVSSAVAEVAARLPGQTHLLAAAGAGSPSPLVEEDLAHVAQLSYQPMRDQEMALDALHGRRAVQDWEHAGPGFFDDSQGRVVFHDGVASMTLMMTVPPGAHITSRSFDRGFRPTFRISGKWGAGSRRRRRRTSS